MKKIYFKNPVSLLFNVIVFFLHKDRFPCPVGQIPESTGYDTTIAFGPGISIIPKNTINTDSYGLKYTVINKQSCVHFFRIKQIFSNGHTRFSDIKSTELISSGLRKFNFYPTPLMALLVSNLRIISTENYSSEFSICRDRR